MTPILSSSTGADDEAVDESAESSCEDDVMAGSAADDVPRAPAKGVA